MPHDRKFLAQRLVKQHLIPDRISAARRFCKHEVVDKAAWIVLVHTTPMYVPLITSTLLRMQTVLSVDESGRNVTLSGHPNVMAGTDGLPGAYGRRTIIEGMTGP